MDAPRAENAAPETHGLATWCGSTLNQENQMSHGGCRAGAGRKPGSGLAKIDAAARKAAMESGITPLEYMLAVLRDEERTPAERMEAAKAAAPYVHARLAHIEKDTELTVSFVARLPS